ncbi:MAG: hypothetical protein J6580_11680, partial [Gilliamella sp.]|uniref:hypothetical protein n=1 Tax=Gilliamella sp. TaxID=1891236 RepID=UPI0025EAF499
AKITPDRDNFKVCAFVINKLLLNSYYQITKAPFLKSQIQCNKQLAYKYMILFKNKKINKINSLTEQF